MTHTQHDWQEATQLPAVNSKFSGQLTCGCIMPFLGFTVGGAAAVDEASHIALVPGINDEARPQLHHVEVGLPLLLGTLHARFTLHMADHLPCNMLSLSPFAY